MAQTPHCPHTDTRFEGKDPSTILDLQRPEAFQFSEFADPWLDRAARSAKRQEWFEALIYLWVSFNAWLGLAVNDRDYSVSDSYLWRAAALDPRFQELYLNRLASNAEFCGAVEGFHDLWPIFKARALAEEGIPPWGELRGDPTRDEYRRMVFSHHIRDRDYSPSCFLDHQRHLGDIRSLGVDGVPTDWEHTLAAIYMVRCNLFHGGKSFRSSKDISFVCLSFKILSLLWWGRLAMPNNSLKLTRRARPSGLLE